jgi:hypothetical protein
MQRNLTDSEFAIIRAIFFFARIAILMMRQDAVKEQNKRGTQTKVSLFFKHGLNNTEHAGYLKCF